MTDHTKVYTYDDVEKRLISYDDYIISEVLSILSLKKKIDRDKIISHVSNYYGHRIEIAILDCIRNTYC